MPSSCTSHSENRYGLAFFSCTRLRLIHFDKLRVDEKARRNKPTRTDLQGLQQRLSTR